MTSSTDAAVAREGQPPAMGQQRVLVIIGALLLGLLLAALDQTIVATALPTIAGDLHGLSHLSWVITAYLLASTVSTPLWGKLGDMYGRKVFFQASIVIFLIGSALSGLAHSMVELIASRAVQGWAAAVCLSARRPSSEMSSRLVGAAATRGFSAPRSASPACSGR